MPGFGRPEKAEAFELYRLLERQRTYLVEQIRATRPFLMELENPLAPAAQKLAEQLAAFPLMTADYSKLTEVLKRFADALPDHQTTDASIIGRLMNNVRLGHYPTDLTHVGYIANSIVFPAENTANLIDPCCGTGDALLRLALGTDSQCYGIELDDHRAEQAQQQLYRVGFGSFFGSNISPGAFHAVFLNPPYLSVLSENGGRSRDEKRFLIESIPLLMMGGLLIYIVPYYRLTADLCGIICDNFEQVRIHRFLDREFKQFKQVVVTGVRRRRTEAEQDAEALCSAAEHPETLPTADLLPKACYELPAVSKRWRHSGGLCSMKTSWPASWQTPPALTGCLPKPAGQRDQASAPAPVYRTGGADRRLRPDQRTDGVRLSAYRQGPDHQREAHRHG